ncbi:M20 family metallopeptidase [Isosphaeraceae bacterium EP7]
MDAVTRLLSDLVSIPSVNPMGRSLKGPDFLETRIGDYLDSYFRDLGVSYTREPVAPGRDNIIARFEPPGSRSTLLFDAHQDTVPVDGMTIPPFEPSIRDGRLYGRGSVDIKGGLAAMLAAFSRLVRERPEGAATVIMACTVDEEFTHIGSSALALNTRGADLAVIAEPTLLDLVDRHKGAVRWKIRTAGVACHSSTPHLGDNAIYRMAGVLDALAEYAGELARSEPDKVLGPPSLSVGRIDGGLSVNVVPDWCEIDIDRRLIPGETGPDAIGRAESYVKAHIARPDLVEFLPPWVNMPALCPDAERLGPWLNPLKAAIQSIRGVAPSVHGVPFGTDAGPIGATGLPCVVFGPGDIAQAHTKDEWVDLDQVRAAAEIYHAMAIEVGRAGR